MADTGLFFDPGTGGFGFNPGDGGIVPAGIGDTLPAGYGPGACPGFGVPQSAGPGQVVAIVSEGGTLGGQGGFGTEGYCWLPQGSQLPQPNPNLQIVGSFDTLQSAVDKYGPLCLCPAAPPPPPPSGGSCPQCGCVTCQCQAKEEKPKVCYKDPDGEYWWINPDWIVPNDWTRCDQAPVPTPQPPADIDSPPNEQPPSVLCLIALPWGSPDWCKCVEQWRPWLDAMGNDLREIWVSHTAQDGEPSDNLIWKVFRITSDFAGIPALKMGAALNWLYDCMDRVLQNIDDTYGQVSNILLGINYIRACYKALMDTKFTVDVGGDVSTDGGIGIALFGTGAGVKTTIKRHQAVAASLGYDLSLAVKVLDQIQQYFIPVGVLSTGDALQLYYTSEIDQDGLKCMFAAAGVHPDFAVPMAFAEREQPSAFEYIIAWRRGALNDQQLADALRGRGWISNQEQQIMVTISEFLPPPTDLIRFMLRSIGDPAIVQRFELEAEFDQLYVGRIKDWGNAAGISEETLRGYHAAHWVVPSPGDLAVFWQRYGEQRNSPQALRLPSRMTATDYDRALREQGIAPFWRPFFIAAQYAVLGRRDLQWGYQFGAIDEVQLRDGFLDASFPPDKVDGLIEVTQHRAMKFWLSDPIVKGYVKAGINEAALTDYLTTAGCPGAVLSDVVDQVKILATELANEETIKLIEKDYETGGLNDLGLLQALQMLQLDQDQIDRIVLILHQRKSARPRQIPARELCQWYGSRLISRSEFASRLITLGYTPLDAELIIAKCESDLTAKQLRTEQLQLKTQANAERRKLKDLTQQERQAQLAKDRAAKALAAQIKAQRQADALLAREQAKEQIASERASRKKEMLAQQIEREELRVLANMEYIVDHWSKLTGLDSAALMPELQNLLAQATADGTVTVAELLASIRQLLAGKPTDLPDQLSDLVSLALGQVQSVPESTPAIATSDGTQGNGQGPTLPVR